MKDGNLGTGKLQAILKEFRSLSKETEWLEFKCNNENLEEIGQYLSALANSAALHQKDRGYIIWGLDDVTHDIIGTKFRPRETKKGKG